MVGDKKMGDVASAGVDVSIVLYLRTGQRALLEEAMRHLCTNRLGSRFGLIYM